MVEILDEYADSSVIELVQTSNLINTYVESVMDVIDKMEENEAIRSSYFTEATEEAEKAAETTANKGVISTIADAISKIFSRIATIFSKGKVSVKGAAQEKTVKSLEDKVNECPAVQITVQNVWEYNSFVENTIDKYIRKFNKKATMSLFSQKCGQGKAIDGLTANMRAMASQMRAPSNKKFQIKKTGAAAKAAKAGKVARRATGAAGAGAVAAATKVGYGVMGKNLVLGAAGKTAAIPVGNTAATTIAHVLSAISITVGPAGPLLAAAGITVAGGFTLAAIHAIWSKCPTHISQEKVTIQELYKRLTSLDAGKFPSKLTSETAAVNKYVQQADTLKAFIDGNEEGSKGATRYAQKIADLMNAYAEFHQALIDFYLSIIIGVIKEGAKMTGKKAYVPKEMINSSKQETTEESVEDDEYEDDDVVEESIEDDIDDFDYDQDVDSDINDYAESVDDMENYMNLDDFVANELSDLAY